MSYDASEKSRHSGAPLECYRFAQGENLWLLTSADRPVVLPAGTFVPAVVSRGEQEFSQEEAAGSIEIRVPRTSPLVAPFISYVPPSPLGVILYRAHRGAEAEAVVAFIGTVSEVRLVGSAAVMKCSPISRSFSMRVPALGYHTQCNWAVYSDRCGVSRAAFRLNVTVTSIEGSVELTRFRGHLIFWEGGVHDGEDTRSVPAGVPAAHG